MMDKISEFDEQLKKVAAGGFGEDAVYALQKFNKPAEIKEALNTNTCPRCRQQIIPEAKTCEVDAFFAHLHSKHPDL